MGVAYTRPSAFEIFGLKRLRHVREDPLSQKNRSAAPFEELSHCGRLCLHDVAPGCSEGRGSNGKLFAPSHLV